MENIATTPGLGNAVQYLSGFVFVLLVLCVLWLVVEAIGYGFCRRKKKAEALAAVDQRLSASAPAVDNPDQLPEEHLVVIAAAVTMLLGRQHRLVSIRSANANWGREGRRQHLHSHSFR